jgi:hypothetical protein
MKFNLRSAISGAAVLAIAGGILASAAGTALAATPSWEPDPNAVGTLTFYNAAGQVVTSGTNLSHLFDYALASTADPTGTSTRATMDFANPQPNVPTGNWFTGQGSLSTAYPNTSAPAPLNTATNPLVTVAATQGNLAGFIPTAPANTQAGFANVYQIRVVTSGGAGGTGSAQYWDADIQVNPTNGTWFELYPTAGTAPAAPTTTAVSAAPNPDNQGVATTLTATETPATPGSVTFSNGTTTIGSASVNASGVATMPYTPTASGTQTITATFAPTDTVDFTGSSGTTSLTVNPPATVTTTSLTVSYTNTSAPVNLSSTVMAGATPVTAGTVSWFDNGSTTPLNSSAVTPTASGIATFSIPAGGLAAGSHSIVAVFTPTNPAAFDASSSAPQAFVLQAPATGACSNTGSNCTSTDTIEATVPTGTLVLSTPYTTTPLNLGTMALNSGLTEYSATATYGNITVVDTRAGDLPWTLTGLSSNLSDGGSNPGSIICSQNVGLTGLTATGSGGFAGTVTTTNNPVPSTPVAPSGGACAGTSGLGGTTAHTIAAATAGLGTVTLSGGTLTLIAPTSTEPSIFKGTITYTVG